MSSPQGFESVVPKSLPDENISNDTACIIAIERGNLLTVVWLIKNRKPSVCLTAHMCEVAAENGHLEILQWLHSIGCPWDSATCEGAAEFGHLECLKYALENDCAITERTFLLAAEVGNFPCLKYLYENGYSFNIHLTNYYAANGQLEKLRIAIEEGFT